MPCRVDPTYVDYREKNSELLEVANKAEAMLDRAREDILAGREPNLTYLATLEKFYNSPRMPSSGGGPYEGYPPDSALIERFEEMREEAWNYADGEWDIEDVRAAQIRHRAEDIWRLRLTFAEAGDEDMLAKTLGIDYTKPLEEQLGFDPDDY